ncbi:hypothetical protein N7G274_008595 [Stereocaulon virgatum]|uniref:Uncharacterized protein n=1 Tax=Stereocaulon virgatum TaxID=373712 RepID=A0ABR3ZYU7_9LECA
MKRENAHRLDGYETYPLSLSPGEPSLQYLHSELERRSPSLFATKSSECNLEVLEAIYKPNACHVASMEVTESAENLQINGPTKPLVSFLSTLVELEETLKNELPPCSVRLLSVHISCETFKERTLL